MNLSNSPIWHDQSGVDRLIAQVNENDRLRRVRSITTKIDKVEGEMLAEFDREKSTGKAMTNDPYILDNYPVLLNVAPTPVCRREDFGNSNCAMPMCDCRAWPPIQFAGPEPRTQEWHAEHLELTWPTRTGSDFRFLLGLCVAVALITTLAILSSPELVAAIIGNWRLK